MNSHFPIPGHAKPCAWSVELLHEMDWHRFREVVRSLVHRQGFVSRVIADQPDGGVVYALSPAGRGSAITALLHCPSWKNDEIDLGQASVLSAMVEHFKVKRGIFVTPGHVTFEARRFAREKPIELVDGWELLDWIHGLPVALQDEFLKMATVGHYQTPACPGCGGRMLLETSTIPGDPPRMMGNLVLRESRFISWPVRCRKLLVKRGIEVHFRRGVVAQEIEIHGRAVGEMLCTGLFHAGSEAIITGGVACKRLKLEQGGVLEGEAVILRDGEWAPEAIAGEWFRQPARVWRCASYQPCEITLEARA